MSNDKVTENSMQQDQLFNDDNKEVAVHVLDERQTFDDTLELYEPDYDEFMVHEQDDIENISDDEEQKLVEQEASANAQVKIILDNKTSASSRPRLTKNQRTNREKRAKRYCFEVICPVYEHFTITNIKRILIDMNIYWININIVGHTLFLGLKRQSIQQQVEALLHEKMFTKEHFQRIFKKCRH
jgi:hypothetical protein